ncbi:hypothetical protein [Paraburkholderia sp.]|uniref:hypothetical protein n=1 Tax=Paraburkholderia sp. TaxID=1926495 RepID=UPI003D6EB88F
MKLSPYLSRYLALAVFALSTVPLVTHAQTSQTYRFGEGQSTLQPVPKSAPQPAPQSAPQPAQAQQAPQAQPPQKAAKPAKRHARQRVKKHRRHVTRRLPEQSLYSHP